MFQFLMRRLIILIPMLFFMSIVSFAIIQAPPGDYLETYIAQLSVSGVSLDLAEVEALRRQYGLDQPIYMQYFKWLWQILQGDLGVSLEWQRPVSELIGERLLMTIILGLVTVVFTWTLAIPIGVISAVKQYSGIDYFFTFLSYFGVGTPNFLIALVAMWLAFSLFGLKLTGLFSQEYQDAPWSFGKVLDMLNHMWIPMLILGTDGTARLTRIVRANLLDELNKPYVETARSKGVPEWKLIIKYPTRLSLNPFISTAGWSLPQLFSGSLILATVMNLPTVGPLLLRSLFAQDMFLSGSVILILSALTLVGTLISDVILAIADPRIRMGQ
ncbi:ABC transporter permease [Chloroflexi bacterium TSY]|nr:ABC transporter permease [Chloroflexi bacterium TSY]